MNGSFLNDIDRVCQRVRERIGAGRLAGHSAAERNQRVVAVLDDVLAAELVCAARYRQEYQLASAIHGEVPAQAFLDYEHEEQEHAEQVARRIDELGGTPRWEPTDLSLLSPTPTNGEAVELEDLIREDLVAERVIVNTYAALAHWLTPHDAPTAELIGEILESELEHAGE